MPRKNSFRYSAILLFSIYFLNGNLFASIYHTKLVNNDAPYSNNIINKNFNSSISDEVGYVEPIKHKDDVLESLTITSPNGGEFWQVGKIPNIIWESLDLVASITLEYSIDNGNSWLIIDTEIPSTQNSYAWDVPNTTSQQCLVRASSGSVSDSSDAIFEISDDTSSCAIVVLGSSTALGFGASAPENSWVNLYSTAIFQKNTKLKVENLSAPGYTTYQILPTGTELPIGVTETIDVDKNITKALSFSPVAIIVNMPSNDTANGYNTSAQLENYNILNTEANTNSVDLWIATPQPRNAFDVADVQIQKDVRDALTSIYTDKAIDFWTDIAGTDDKILPVIDSGDGIHVNDIGHNILFNKVLSKNIDVATCITEPLGLTDMKISDNFNLKVYPNPVTDFISLNFQSILSGNLKATFFDVLGRKLIPTQPDFNFNAGQNSIIMNFKELEVMRGQIIFGLFTFNTNSGLIQKSVKLMLE
jgi:hypothetical protein